MNSRTESISEASYVQRSMWAASQRYRTTPLNVMNLAWRLEGPLSLDALNESLNDLVARHPTMRARLVLRSGRLMQEVLAPDTVTIKSTVVKGASLEEKLAAAHGMLRGSGSEPIDVVIGPPVRAHLVQLSPGDHILCLHVHHSMCDGWSGQIVIKDLLAFYKARSLGSTADVSSLTLQYADIAASQFHTYETGGYADEIAYWKAELAGLADPVALPTRNPRKGNRDFMASSPLHRESTAALASYRAASREIRVSTFAFLLSSLAALLHQRTGVEDLVIGVPTLNRWSPEAMGVVGCATSLLPARIRPRSDMRFDELCTQVHATVRKLLAYGRIPLELILKETQESPLAGPVFPVWCQSRQDALPIQVQSLGLRVSPILIERGTILADLDVDMLESASGLTCEFAHRKSLFEANWIDELTAQYGAMLGHAAMATDARVGELWVSETF